MVWLTRPPHLRGRPLHVLPLPRHDLRGQEQRAGVHADALLLAARTNSSRPPAPDAPTGDAFTDSASEPSAMLSTPPPPCSR